MFFKYLIEDRLTIVLVRFCVQRPEGCVVPYGININVHQVRYGYVCELFYIKKLAGSLSVTKITLNNKKMAKKLIILTKKSSLLFSLYAFI